jgi:hypothetical protein
MAAFMLESLVLRGSVLLGELAVVVRHGTSVAANRQSPEIDNSTRNPLHSGYRPTSQPADPDGPKPNSGVMPGAGRSRRWFGSPTFAGCSRAAVTTRQAIPAGVATPASAGLSARLACLPWGKKES